MAYSRNTTWQNLPSTATPIDATRFNVIEDGLVVASIIADQALSAALSAAGVIVQSSEPTATAAGQFWLDSDTELLHVSVPGVGGYDWTLVTSGDGASVTVSSTAPESPQAGALWYDLSDTTPLGSGGSGSGVSLEEMRDDLASVLTAGANVTITPNDAANTITIASSTGGGASIYVNSSPPASPTDGALWYDTDDTTPIGSGGGLASEDIYPINLAMLVEGTGIDIVGNGSTLTITNTGVPGPTGPAGPSGGDQTWKNVKNYGASTAASAATNTTAIQNAMAAAATGSKVIFFPAGTYLVNPNAIRPPLGSNWQGFTFVGEGPYSTMLQMATQTTESYFYDNNGNGTTLTFSRFRDMAFLGGPVSTGAERGAVNFNHNFMRMYGPTDQNFRFTRCRWGTLNGVFTAVGGNNVSEIVFEDCKISHIADYVLRLDNQQALNFTFLATDIEFIWGNIVNSINSGGTDGGGGMISFHGGSMIVEDWPAKHADGGCAVKIEYNVTCAIAFYGVRMELRTDGEFFRSTGNHTANVLFHGGGFFNVDTSGGKIHTTVRGNQTVKFDTVQFEHNGSFATYSCAETVNQPQPGRITWVNCRLRNSISEEITFPGGYGLARAIDCVSRDTSLTDGVAYAMDFDLGPGSSSAGGMQPGAANVKVKRAYLKRGTRNWPKSDGAGGSTGDSTVQLPVGAIITRIVVRRPASGSNANTYQLQVSNNDKTTVHGSSTSAAQNVLHSIDVSPWFECGATTNSRIVRVSVSGSTSNSATADIATGFGFVEYI